MSIFLTGSTGFIGSHILQALCQKDYIVTCLIRRSSKTHLLSQPAAKELMSKNRLNIVEAEWTSPAEWLEHVADHDVVINSVGIIRERHHGDFDSVHNRAPIALFQRAQDTGTSKIIQISALGADETATSQFHISKRKADRFLAALAVPHVILRPSFVYGGKGSSSMTFFTRLAALPVTPVPGDGQYRVQPIHIKDLITAIMIIIEHHDWCSTTIDAGGGDILTFDQMLDVLGKQIEKPVKHWHIPWKIMNLIAKATDLTGGYGPITTEELTMLRRGNFSDNQKFVEFFGFQPRTFSEGIIYNDQEDT